MAKPIDSRTLELMLAHRDRPREISQATVMRQLNIKHGSQFYLMFYRAILQEHSLKK